MRELVETATLHLATSIEVAAALIIGGATLEAVLRSALVFAHRGSPESDKDAVRIRLGRWLALALEFLLAADILRTAVAPSWTEIGQLGAIIVLRTVLNYFLQREISETEHEREGAGERKVDAVARQRTAGERGDAAGAPLESPG